MKERFRSRTMIAMLSAVLVMLLLFTAFQSQQVHALEVQVNMTYQKAFFETVTLMDGITSNLEKLMISGSGAKEQELLGSISRQADAAQDNLSILPASLPAIAGSLKFVNQLGDYAVTLSDRLAAGGAVSDRDSELMMTLHTTSVELTEVLLEMSDAIQRGENPFENVSEVHEAAVPLSMRSEPAIEYPSLLYDGPFSDGRRVDQLRALDDTIYTAEQALEIARAFIGEERVLSARMTGTASIPAACYEITVQVKEGELSMAVTRQGGQVVYMLCDSDAEESRFSQAELIDLAAIFLKNRGYPPVTVSYWSYDDHLLTVNFAAMQDGIILYPDLVKVQMDASTGMVVGLEAFNYLANHVHRTDLSPTLTEEDAQSLLGPLLTVERSRLCVIPTDSGEALCYEFSGTAGANRYLVYIDAHNGREREIYRVIEEEDGQLAI